MIATAGPDCVKLWHYNHASTEKLEPFVTLEAVEKISRGVFNFDATKLILLPRLQSALEANIIAVDIESRAITEFTGPSQRHSLKEIVASCVDTKFAAFTHGRGMVIWIYDTSTPGAPLLSIRMNNHYRPCVSPDLSCFFTCMEIYDLDTAAVAFDENTAVPTQTLYELSHEDLLSSCFSEDGTMFCGLFSDTVRVWNSSCNPWELQMRFKFYHGDDEDGEDPCYASISALCFNPSKTAVVAFYLEEGARIRSAATGVEIGFIPIYFTPTYDGLFITTDDVIVVGSQSGIRLYDIHGQPLVAHIGGGRPVRIDTTEDLVLGGTHPRNILL